MLFPLFPEFIYNVASLFVSSFTVGLHYIDIVTEAEAVRMTEKLGRYQLLSR